MTAKAVAIGAAGFVLVPFVVTGMFRLGLPNPAPFVLMLVVAATCWVRTLRALAVGIALGAVAWAIALAVILMSMGEGIDTIG